MQSGFCWSECQANFSLQKDLNNIPSVKEKGLKVVLTCYLIHSLWFSHLIFFKYYMYDKPATVCPLILYGVHTLVKEGRAEGMRHSLDLCKWWDKERFIILIS